jgi:hypothetical protein
VEAKKFSSKRRVQSSAVWSQPGLPEPLPRLAMRWSMRPKWAMVLSKVAGDGEDAGGGGGGGELRLGGSERGFVAAG